MEERCIICRKEIPEKIVKKRKGKVCDSCMAKSTVCVAPGCFEKAVWQIIGGEKFCPKHLANLEAEELMY
jgi:hypothetical protein